MNTRWSTPNALLDLRISPADSDGNLTELAFPYMKNVKTRKSVTADLAAVLATALLQVESRWPAQL